MATTDAAAANRAAFRQYHDALNRLGAEVLPEAIAASLTRVGRAAHGAQAMNLRQRFTIRNQYTERSLRFYQARPKRPMDRINAIVGSVSPYLPIQEEGGTIKARSRFVPIPTRAGRGGNPQRVIPRRFRLSALGNLGTKGSRFFIANFSGRRGIYFRPSKRRLVMIRDLSQSAVRVKPTRWHTDAMTRFGRPGILTAAFKQEAERRLAAAGAR